MDQTPVAKKASMQSIDYCVSITLAVFVVMNVRRAFLIDCCHVDWYSAEECAWGVWTGKEVGDFNETNLGATRYCFPSLDLCPWLVGWRMPSETGCSCLSRRVESRQVCCSKVFLTFCWNLWCATGAFIRRQYWISKNRRCYGVRKWVRVVCGGCVVFTTDRSLLRCHTSGDVYSRWGFW